MSNMRIDHADQEQMIYLSALKDLERELWPWYFSDLSEERKACCPLGVSIFSAQVHIMDAPFPPTSRPRLCPPPEAPQRLRCHILHDKLIASLLRQNVSLIETGLFTDQAKTSRVGSGRVKVIWPDI